MMKNAISDLLESVRETGTLPTRPEVDFVIRRGGRAERDAVAKAILRDARQIRLLGQGRLDTADEDVDGEIGRIIADAAESNARYVAADPAAETAAASDVVAKIVQAGKDGGTASYQERRAAAKEARHRMQPLRDLFTAVANGYALRDADIESLDLDPSADDAARAKFRGDVVRSAKRIAKLYADGCRGDARAAAQQHAAEYGGLLAGPRTEDPAAGIEDPRELAAMISSRSNNRG